MKKHIKTYWQIIIFPALYIPYSFINTKVIVKWLGCGCPKIDEHGNMIANSFNANDFTLIFWNIIALIVIAISLFNMRNFTKWHYKLIYILLITAVSFFIAISFYYSMQWN